MNNNILVYETISVKETLKKLDQTAEKILFVVDQNNRLLGTITDGDIRRYILRGKNLTDNIQKVYNKQPISLKHSEYSISLVEKILVEKKIDVIPLLNKNKQVIDYVTWNQVFAEQKDAKTTVSSINIPAVIMAGGEGIRMEPLTRILPKPLIPIGEKPIVEIIMDEFHGRGVNSFFLILNYKSEMIKSYLNTIKKKYEFQCICESKLLGTAGGLKLLTKVLGDTFIVSNCDIIVKANLNDVLTFHRKGHAALTVLSSIKHYKIPYGVVHFKNKGKVTEITEKPEYTFTVNTGVYILEKQVLRFIPLNTRYDMTDLIRTLILKKKQVVTYPVNENDYTDIGQWEEYRRALDKLQILR